MYEALLFQNFMLWFQRAVLSAFRTWTHSSLWNCFVLLVHAYWNKMCWIEPRNELNYSDTIPKNRTSRPWTPNCDIKRFQLFHFSPPPYVTFPPPRSIFYSYVSLVPFGTCLIASTEAEEAVWYQMLIVKYRCRNGPRKKQSTIFRAGTRIRKAVISNIGSKVILVPCGTEVAFSENECGNWCENFWTLTLASMLLF